MFNGSFFVVLLEILRGWAVGHSRDTLGHFRDTLGLGAPGTPRGRHSRDTLNLATPGIFWDILGLGAPGITPRIL